MSRLLLLVLVVAGSVEAQLVSNPHLDIQVMHYAGTTNKTWYLDGIKGVNDMRVHGTWDARKIGKPPPTNMTQLASVEVALAWYESFKSTDERDKESLKSYDKLLDEVLKLSKELNAVKDKQK